MYSVILKEKLNLMEQYIELELSIAIGKGVFIISNEFRVIIGFINNNNSPKIEINRKIANKKLIFDFVLEL